MSTIPIINSLSLKRWRKVRIGNKSEFKMAREVDMEGNEKLALRSFY